MISLKNVSKTFPDGTRAVRDIVLDIREGETLVLLGSSGCGKTTTLKMINRLIEPSAGRILVDGRDIMERGVTELRRSIGYCFQGIGLFPHMTVVDNITVVPRLLGWSSDKRRRRAEELMEMINLPPADYAYQYPDQLSGGQQQRVGVARALAADSSYLLMDEPFGALDALTRDQLQQELLKIKKEIGKTVIFVTHDIFEALTLGDRIAVMHEGVIEQTASGEDILTHPETEFVRDLFGKPANQLKLFYEEG
ncbi:MAG: ATP-binding cassette domain-containing protein [Spirochaetota bacterium]|nr:ATP-binding cassette domain-containing protein [Spirochaetota bacterium]